MAEPPTAELPWVPPTTCAILDRAAAEAPDDTALILGDARLSYRDYAAAVDGFARALAGAGAAGRPIAIVLRNSIELAITLFAAQRVGLAMALNPDYTPAELAPMLADAAPALVVTHADLVDRVRAAGFESAVIVADSPTDLPRAEVPLPAIGPETLASLQFTGGTTGRAKGVLLTHGAIATNVAQREARLPTRWRDEVVALAMPLYHSFASAMGLHLAAYAAGTLVILPRYRPDTLLAAIATHRATRLPAGPTLFASLLAHEGLAAADLGSLRSAWSGSAPLPAATLARWLTAGRPMIFEGYGQTEAGPVLTYAGVGVAPKAGTVGRPLAATVIEIVDVATGLRAMPPGEAGEIRAKGPQLMSGYLGRPAETAAALRDGWLYTGDIGYFDAAGDLVIADRAKDMAIVGGFNVYPREIDEVIAAMPGVREAAAIGVADAYRGEVIWAWVAGDGVDEAAVLGHCAERLVKYKWPARVRLVNSLPHTALGKVDRAALKALAAAG